MRDRQRVSNQVNLLAGFIDLCTPHIQRSPSLTILAARLFTVAYNLELNCAFVDPVTSHDNHLYTLHSNIKAAHWFLRAIDYYPQDAELRHAYGCFLGGSSDPYRAVLELTIAVRLGYAKAGLSLAYCHYAYGKIN